MEMEGWRVWNIAFSNEILIFLFVSRKKFKSYIKLSVLIIFI